MRLLVTGSRNWCDVEWIRRELLAVVDAFPCRHGATLPTLIHGGNGVAKAGRRYRVDPSPEADAIADRLWRSWGYPVQVFRADWKAHGRAAGPIRNKEMIETARPDVCLAFIRDDSRGSVHCARTAAEHGIPVWYFRHWTGREAAS